MFHLCGFVSLIKHNPEYLLYLRDNLLILILRNNQTKIRQTAEERLPNCRCYGQTDTWKSALRAISLYEHTSLLLNRLKQQFAKREGKIEFSPAKIHRRDSSTTVHSEIYRGYSAEVLFLVEPPTNRIACDVVCIIRGAIALRIYRRFFATVQFPSSVRKHDYR